MILFFEKLLGLRY